MQSEQFTIRAAQSEDEPQIAALVIEGFIDKFRPVFGRRMDQSIKIMKKWIELEHSSGGVESFVIEGCEPDEIAASVGVRTKSSNDEAMARGLWRSLNRNLGPARALWATTLLSYPRYSARSSEAYIERLVVSPGFRRQGMAKGLLDAAENLAGEEDKKTLGLHVSGNNLPAMRLYEDEGFAEASRQKSLLTGYFLGIKNWIYLRKTLSQ